MTPDHTTTEGKTQPGSAPQPGISRAAQFYMGLRAEANGGGAPAATVPPPADAGQGGGAGGGTPAGGDGGFNWELFPDVPEEQRSLLEPHLKKVQGHVTKLEQSHAPFKAFSDAGIDEQSATGLIQLSQSFSRDPMGTWVAMGRQMQQEGTLPDNLDIDAAEAILKGEDLEESPEGGQEGKEGDQLDPRMKEVLDWKQQEEARRQQEQQTATQQRQEQALKGAEEGIKGQLKEAGLSDQEIEAANITGAIITAKGDPDAALRNIISFWEAAKGRLTKPTDENENELEMPKGAPEAKDTGLKGRRGSKSFDEANKGARQFLKRRREES